jgi:hypothetical protein
MTTIYVVCFLVGLGLSVVTFILGADGIHILDDVHVLDDVHSDGMPALNLSAMTAFVAWFGGTGVVLQQTTAWNQPAIAGGATAAGLIGGTVVNRFLRVLKSREKPMKPTSIVGLIARVTSPIRADGTGEIVFSLNGTRAVSAARSEMGKPVEKGSEVVVVRYERGIAYVNTWDQLV